MSLSEILADSPVHSGAQLPARCHMKVPGTCSKLCWNSTVGGKILGNHIQKRRGEVGKCEDATRQESDS